MAVVPAYAGVIPTEDGYMPQYCGGSRVCGGDPDLFCCRQLISVWFPRMRG